MIEEKETPLAINTINDKELSSNSNKKLKRIFIISPALLIILGVIIFLSLLSSSTGAKKENHNPMKLNDENTEKNYIKAIYECPGDYQDCQYFDNSYNFTLSISSMTVNGETISVTNYQQFAESGVKEVVIYFNKKIENIAGFSLILYI